MVNVHYTVIEPVLNLYYTGDEEVLKNYILKSIFFFTVFIHLQEAGRQLVIELPLLKPVLNVMMT